MVQTLISRPSFAVVPGRGQRKHRFHPCRALATWTILTTTRVTNLWAHITGRRRRVHARADEVSLLALVAAPVPLRVDPTILAKSMRGDVQQGHDTTRITSRAVTS
jgi:hypothetical protein